MTRKRVSRRRKGNWRREKEELARPTADGDPGPRLAAPGPRPVLRDPLPLFSSFQVKPESQPFAWAAHSLRSLSDVCTYM